MIRYIFLSLLVCSSGIAAPFPVTGSSVFMDAKKGLYLLPKGYSVSTQATSWKPALASSSDGTIRFVPSEKKSQASLTVRTDRLQKGISMEIYSRRWMRDYPNYGFEVLSAKNTQIKETDAMVVDMISREKNRQIRQVIIHNQDRVAILTCQDERQKFSETVNACNRITESFRWNSEEVL